MSKFKVGDEVRVVRGDYEEKCKGRIGKYLKMMAGYLECDFGDGFDGWGDGCTHWHVKEADVEVVSQRVLNESTDMKAGDKVEYIALPTICFTPGKIYEVGGHFHSLYGGRGDRIGILANDRGNEDGWPRRNFKFPASSPPAGSASFYAGQKVRLLVDDSAYSRGDVVDVTAVAVYFEDRDGDERHLLSTQVQPVSDDGLKAIAAATARTDLIKKLRAQFTPAQKPVFEPGQIVDIEHPDTGEKTVGIIAAWPDGDGDYRVEYGERIDEWSYFGPRDMKLAA